MIEFSLILPVHNEEEIIEKVYKEIYNILKKTKAKFEVFLVENGSKDNSLKIIKQLEKKFPGTHAIVSPKGYGNAVIEGFTHARGKYIAHMPSDGQIDVTLLPTLLQTIRNGQYDMVKVKRVSRENLNRYTVSILFDTVIMLFYQIPFLDVNGDPKLFKRSELQKLHLSYKDSFIDAELLVKACYLKWKIKEFPMQNIDRYGGKSTRSIRTFTEFFKNIYQYRISTEFKNWKRDNTN